MPRDGNNEYIPPANWSEIEHPEFGNQADWVYAILSALNERLAVHGGDINNLRSFGETQVLNSYMFFEFAQKVENTILNMVSEVLRKKASNGDILAVYSENGMREEYRKWNGWLNPEEPMIVGENIDDDVWIAGPMGYANYNFLDGKQLLQLSGCNFREPLTTGFSSLETCFPVWFDRVKCAINKLHISPVPVNWAATYFWGNGYYSNYDDETMGGAAVDGVAWNNAASDYGDHGDSNLPAGDSHFYYPDDKYHFYCWNYTRAERRKIDKTVIPYAEWTYRSSIYIDGMQIFVKRLRFGSPCGCHVYIGGVSTTGSVPNGGYQYDEFHDGNHAQNTLFTIDCGRVLATDPYRYIDGPGWKMVIDDTEKYHPPYEEPTIEPGEGSAMKRTIWGHDLECKFYADWAEDSDGFQFKEEEEE